MAENVGIRFYIFRKQRILIRIVYQNSVLNTGETVDRGNKGEEQLRVRLGFQISRHADV